MHMTKIQPKILLHILSVNLLYCKRKAQKTSGVEAWKTNSYLTSTY